MNIIRIAFVEIRRMTTGLLPKIAVGALSLIPVLYGAVYLYANWDPYDRLDNVPAALVNLDEGAAVTEADTPQRLQVGDEVAEQLVDARTFGWVQVSSQQEADEGVRSGRFSFALTIPRDFSANLASPSNFNSAEQAILTVTTNDANNYLLSSIVDKLAGEVHNTVASKVGKKTADAMLTGFGRIHTQLVRASDGAEQLHGGTTKLVAGVGDLATGAQQLSTGIDTAHNGATKLASGANRLSSGLATLDNKTSTLPESTRTLNAGASQLADGARSLKSGAEQVADGNELLDQKVSSAFEVADEVVTDAERRFDNVTQRLVDDGVLTEAELVQLRQDFRDSRVGSTAVAKAQQLKADAVEARTKVHALAEGSRKVADGAASLSSGAGRLAAGTAQLNQSVPALTAAIGDASDGAAKLSTGADELLAGTAKLSAGGHSLTSGVGKLAAGAKQIDAGTDELATQLGAGARQVPNPKDKDRIATVIGDPVSIQELEQARAGSYGAGLAPFFLVLAIWIGAFILVQIMRPISNRALASNGEAWKIALGSWLPFLFLSMIQTALLYLVVLFGLGLRPAYPWLTLGLMMLASATFTALVHGTVALMGAPGKFLVLILLVLQLVSSGGTFPWETLPEPLHSLHQWLPMGYVVTGMRHLIYGSDLALLADVVWPLIGFCTVGLAFGLLAVVKNRRWTLTSLQPEMVV